MANAGLILAGTLMARLGLLALIERWVRTGSANPGPKICTVVAAMLAGATHIDHVGMLRAGRTGRVLGFRPMAPSTVGTFRRTFTFGHVRQLEAVLSRTLARAWGLGAGPGDEPLVVDLDSTICEVHGKQKQGAAYGLHQRARLLNRSGFVGDSLVWFSSPGWGGLVGSVERCFEFCGRGVVAVAMEPLLVEPVHPAQGGEFELVDVVPAVCVGPVGAFGLVEPVGRGGQCVVIGIGDGADAGAGADLVEAFGESQRRELAGFNRSSQHRVVVASVGVRRGLLLGSSIRGSCVAGC